jgi:hypothetical protein
MDPAQLASEACRRYAAMSNTSTQAATSASAPAEPLLEVFGQLGTLDGWAKIAMNRLTSDPQDGRAQQELQRSCEQAARLHPHFTRRLADVLADRPSVKTALSATGPIPAQPARTPSEPLA